MARVTSRSRKTKPSKKSKIRRRQFLKSQKLSERREHVKKEKEAEGTISAFQVELKDFMNMNTELREELKKKKIGDRQGEKELLEERDKIWRKKMLAREEQWKEFQKNQEKAFRERERLKGEKEKQDILESRAQLLTEKRHVEFERDRLAERVEELENEVADLKEKFRSYYF